MTIPPRLFAEFEARSELAPVELKCRRCVERAEAVWTAACEAVPRLRKAARGRGRNALFHELVADFAREEFDGEADIELCEQYGGVHLFFKGLYDLGFKKVDSQGRASTYPTPRHKRRDAQLPLWGEPMEEAIRLNVGIQWNEPGTEVIDVLMTLPYRRRPLWQYPLAADTRTVRGTATPVAGRAKAKFRSTVAKPAADQSMEGSA